MPDSTLKVEHVRKTVLELRKQAAGLIALADMLDARIEGTATLGEQMKRVSDAWGEQWSRRYQRNYVFAGAKDATSVKRLLKDLEPDDVIARIPVYLANDDPFFRRSSHSLAMFASTINQHAVSPGLGLEAPAAPVGCKHKPPCRSDAAHTDRMLAEARAR